MIRRLVFFNLILLCNVGAKPDKIVTVSIAKCGTNMLSKLIQMMDGGNFNFIPTHTLLSDYQQKIINRWNSKQLLFLHIPYKFKDYVLPHVKVGFFVLRDPRDKICSYAQWKQLARTHPDFYFKPLDERIMIGIKGSNSIKANPNLFADGKYHDIVDVGTFYKLFLPWQSDPKFLIVHFEDLIGPRGGGSEKKQLETIRLIARHLGKNFTEEEILNFANRLFGNSPTFREGQIGSWKKLFNEAHKKAFKKIAGQLLIDLGYEKDFNW